MDDDTEFTSGRDEIYPGAAGDIIMTYDSQGRVIPVAGEAGGGNSNIPGGGGTGSLPVGAGFGAGQVIGGDAARRQQEILTGSQYSANMPPPGYRSGFAPEYLYFGDPRYSDYAALLPGVYGSGYQPAPVGPTPEPTPTPTPTPTPAIDPATGLPMYSGDQLNFSQSDIDTAMNLILSGQYDIDSLAAQLGVPQETAYNLYNQYLQDTYGVGTYDPNREYSEQELQNFANQYYGVSDQYGYNPEQISRVFGSPLDRTREYMSQRYLGGIPVDQDYSADEYQKVYDLYNRGVMGVTGIANYFGIPESEAQSILDGIGASEGSAANYLGAQNTQSADAAAAAKAAADKAAADKAAADAAAGRVSLADSTYDFGIPVDNDYNASEYQQVFDLYSSGAVNIAQISEYFGLPQSEIQNILNGISAAGGSAESFLSSSTSNQDQNQAARSSDRASGAADALANEETEGDFETSNEDRLANEARLAGIRNSLGIAVDGDYGVSDYQTAYDAYKSGQVSSQDLAAVFNVSPDEVNRILTGIENSEGSAARFLGGETYVGDDLGGNSLGIEVDGDYDAADYQNAYDAYKNGSVSVQDLSDMFGVPVGEISEILTGIENSDGNAATFLNTTATSDSTPDASGVLDAAGMKNLLVGQLNFTENADGSLTDPTDGKIFRLVDGKWVTGSAADAAAANTADLNNAAADKAAADAAARAAEEKAAADAAAKAAADAAAEAAAEAAADAANKEKADAAAKAAADAAAAEAAAKAAADKAAADAAAEAAMSRTTYVRRKNPDGTYSYRSFQGFGRVEGDEDITEDDYNRAMSIGGLGIDRDGDYSQADRERAYELYASGAVTAQDLSDYFGMPLNDVNTTLSNIAQSRQQAAADVVGSTTVDPTDVRNTDRSSGAVTGRDDTEGQGVNPITVAMDLYASGAEMSTEQIRETLEYAMARGISFSQLDQMFGAPSGSAQDAASALGLGSSAGGIVGMAKGGKFPDLSGDGKVTQEDILIGRGVIKKAEGGLLSGIAGLFEKEEEPKPQGGALLTETESYLEAQRILKNPDSSDRDRAFARGTLETLKPEQQGGNMDMNSYSEMMQQVDKILGATRNMQEGGYIGRDQLDSLISMTRDAILGDAENADRIIQAFISVFGQEAFEQLRDQVLQSQVPDAQTEGMIEGSGGGMDDEVMGMIGNQQGVAVSPGEYIIPADVVSSLGDGSSDAGADKLDKMLDDVRMAKTGRTIQPGKIDNKVIPA